MSKTFTVQSAPDQLFMAMLKFHPKGELFTSLIVGFPYFSLVQIIEIKGIDVVVTLHRDRYVSSFALFDKKDFERKDRRITREDAIFLVFGGKVEGYVGKETYKNSLYWDIKGKTLSDNQETFLGVVMETGKELLKIETKVTSMKLESRIPVRDIQLLEFIPEKIPKGSSAQSLLTRF